MPEKQVCFVSDSCSVWIRDFLFPLLISCPLLVLFLIRGRYVMWEMRYLNDRYSCNWPVLSKCHSYICVFEWNSFCLSQGSRLKHFGRRKEGRDSLLYFSEQPLPLFLDRDPWVQETPQLTGNTSLSHIHLSVTSTNEFFPGTERQTHPEPLLEKPFLRKLFIIHVLQKESKNISKIISLQAMRKFLLFLSGSVDFMPFQVSSPYFSTASRENRQQNQKLQL